MRKILIASIFVFAFCAFAFGQNSTCPTISVTGPKELGEPDGKIDFTATVSGIDTSKVRYKWTVSEGKIVQGQGTPHILVSIKGLYDNAIKATVEFSNLPEGCPNTGSETGIISIHFRATIIDEIEISSIIKNERLDAMLALFKEKPDSHLYIIINPGEKTSAQKVKEKQVQIENYLAGKDIPADQINILIGKGESDSIQFWKVPPGAEAPTP